MREWPATDTNRLQCVECDRVSREDERGWKGHLVATAPELTTTRMSAAAASANG